MLQDQLTKQATLDGVTPKTRIGDLAAMLRIMQPLNLSLSDQIVGRRRLLADLCRFIGVKVGTLPPEALGVTSSPAQKTPSPDTPPEQVSAAGAESNAIELSRRMEQTLQHLLNGDSEKQVARKLELSQHTVHGYVKALYRKFGVRSRAELLAKQLRK